MSVMLKFEQCSQRYKCMYELITYFGVLNPFDPACSSYTWLIPQYSYCVPSIYYFCKMHTPGPSLCVIIMYLHLHVHYVVHVSLLIVYMYPVYTVHVYSTYPGIITLCFQFCYSTCTLCIPYMLI